MRFFILGANGKTGTQLIDLALTRGHQVTAFVRSPHKITRTDPGLDVVRGDPFCVEELAGAMRGHDAVFSALGVKAREIFGPVSLVEPCAASTVAGMTVARVRRLVLVSATTLFPGRGLSFAFVRWLLAHQIRDLDGAETIVRATGLDWTIARPPRLVRSDCEEYRSASEALPDGSRSMSFRAVALFMLDAAERGAHVREIVGLAG